MPYSLFDHHRPYRMISYAVRPYTEMARWVMDRLEVEYAEESHVPMLHFLLVRQTDKLPRLIVPEKMLDNAREILSYWDGLAPGSEKLMPPGNNDAAAFIERFYWKTGMAARCWAYLLRMRTGPGDSLDDDGVRRNISGLIVGAVDTTSAALARATDQLLRRPRGLALARAAARAGDTDTVSKYVFEAPRFNPQAAGILRFCPDGAPVGARSKRETAVPSGTTVLLGTLSAMFDPDVFADPAAFRVDRDPSHYPHFGHGMHMCYGRPINMIQIPEIAQALLKLGGLRRASGSAGRIVI